MLSLLLKACCTQQIILSFPFLPRSCPHEVKSLFTYPCLYPSLKRRKPFACISFVLNFLVFLLSRTIIFINLFLILEFPGYAGTRKDIYFYIRKPRITCATDGMPDLKLHLIQTSWFSKP